MVQNLSVEELTGPKLFDPFPYPDHTSSGFNKFICVSAWCCSSSSYCGLVLDTDLLGACYSMALLHWRRTDSWDGVVVFNLTIFHFLDLALCQLRVVCDTKGGVQLSKCCSKNLPVEYKTVTSFGKEVSSVTSWKGPTHPPPNHSTGSLTKATPSQFMYQKTQVDWWKYHYKLSPGRQNVRRQRGR